jgi:hypothetical protein
MARGVRKAASDSLRGQLEAAQASDHSTTPVPKLAGDECLTDIGKGFLADLYRSDPDRWTTGDLVLMVEAAFIHQQLHTNRMVCAITPPTVVLNNGVMGRHPNHIYQADLTKSLQTILRDMGVRAKDGFKAARRPVQINGDPADGGNVKSFEEYLNDVMTDV